MCGSVLETVQDIARDVLGTPRAAGADAADAIDDLFSSADDDLSAEFEFAALEDMAGDLFGDVHAGVVDAEPDSDTLSGFDTSSGLTEAGQIVIPEGYSPPAFLFEVTELLDDTAPAELDPSQLITEQDFDIATAFDIPLEPTFDPSFDTGWNGHTDIGHTEILQTAPDRF